MNTDLANCDQPKFSSGAVFGLRFFIVIVGLAMIGWAFSGDPRVVGGAGFGLAHALLIAVGTANLVASTMRVNILLGLLVAQIAMFGTLIIAETLLRVTLGHRYYSSFQLDQRYLYNLIPHARRAYRHLPVNGGHEVVYHINSYGFRGPPLAMDSNKTIRIVVYGDSFIQAEYTELEETFPKQLERILSERTNLKFEVINAGVAGYGPDQVLRRIEDELEWMKPDLLIVAIYAGNDFGDLVRNKLYRLTPGGEVTPNTYEFSEEIRLNARLQEHELILKRIARDARNRVSARISGAERGSIDQYRTVLAALQQHLDEYQEFVIENDNVVRQLQVDPYSADISLLPKSQSAQYKLAKMDAIVANINAVARSMEVPLFLVTIPHPMDVMGGEHESGAVDLVRFPNYKPERLTDSMQYIAERHKVSHLNLFPYFRQSDDPAELYLKGGDDHWNSEGQRYAAELVANYLLESDSDFLDPTVMTQ